MSAPALQMIHSMKNKSYFWDRDAQMGISEINALPIRTYSSEALNFTDFVLFRHETSTVEMLSAFDPPNFITPSIHLLRHGSRPAERRAVRLRHLRHCVYLTPPHCLCNCDHCVGCCRYFLDWLIGLHFAMFCWPWDATLWSICGLVGRHFPVS